MSPYWHAPPGRELVRPYFFQDNERLPQYRTEEVLRRKMASLDNVEARFGWTATSIAQDADGVTVEIAKDGERESRDREIWRADYVVGCDGPRSFVRDQIGIKRGGTDFDQLMVLIVFRSRELHEGLKRFPERSTYRVLRPDLNGYWEFFGRIDVGEGWFFHAPVPNDTTRDNFDFHGLLEKAAGFKFTCEFDHVGFWDLRVAVAETYQVGRAFIAGDAAHSHPPYGGFGLNNGLEDVANLGWKLAARLAGWGGESLLTSYCDERRPIFKEIAEDFIAARIRKDAEVLSRHDPVRERKAFEKVWAQWGHDIDWVKVYEPHYEGSPLVAGPQGGKSSAHGAHDFAARAGHHLAPQLLSSGRNVYQELGRDFTLLAFDAADPTVGEFESAARALGAPLKVIRDSYAEGRQRYGARVVLIRPDQYVAWAGDEPPDGAQALLRKACGR